LRLGSKEVAELPFHVISHVTHFGPPVEASPGPGRPGTSRCRAGTAGSRPPDALTGPRRTAGRWRPVGAPTAPAAPSTGRPAIPGRQATSPSERTLAPASGTTVPGGAFGSANCTD